MSIRLLLLFSLVVAFSGWGLDPEGSPNGSCIDPNGCPGIDGGGAMDPNGGPRTNDGAGLDPWGLRATTDDGNGFDPHGRP